MSKLLIDERPLQVLPKLAAQIGLNEAIMLQQLHYWLKHATVNHEGKMWIYKSHDRWKEQDFPFWSVDTIRRTATSLKKQELLLVQKLGVRSAFDRTNHYTINYPKLKEVEDLIDAKQAKKPVVVDSSNLPLSNSADCINDGSNLPLSHSGNLPPSHSSNLPLCLREQKETNEEDKPSAKTTFDFLEFYEQAQDHLKLAGMIPAFGPVNDTQLKPEVYKFVQYHSSQGTDSSELGKRLISWFQKFSKEDMRRFFTAEQDLNSQPLHASHQPSVAQQAKPHDPSAVLAAIEAGKRKAAQKKAGALA